MLTPLDDDELDALLTRIGAPVPGRARVTLSGPGLGDRLIATSTITGERTEREVAPDDVAAVLAVTFGIHLETMG